MSDSARDLLARYQQASIDESLATVAELYAEDAVHEFPFTRPGLPSRLEGRDEIIGFLEANWGSSPLHYSAYRDVVIHDTADPDVIVVEQQATGTSTATGRHFALPNIIVLRVRDGRIVHIRDYVNLTDVADALGREV